jgi:vacuolar-type H+-ATPase subunit H
MANIQPHLNKAKDEVKAAAGEVKREVQDTVSDYTDRAKDVASNVTDKAREVASSVMDRAKDAASNLGQKAQDGLEAAGSGLTSAAGTIRENLPSEGMLRNVGERVAEGLETSGRYISEEGFSGMADDLTDLIRRNPIPALLVGVAVGFLLARATTRHS